MSSSPKHSQSIFMASPIRPTNCSLGYTQYHIINLPGRPQLHHMCHFVHPITFKPLTELRQLIILPVSLTISTITEVCTLTLTQDKARICPGNKQKKIKKGMAHHIIRELF